MQKVLVTVLAGSLLGGCSEGAAPPAEPLASAASEITYGELDTTHQAVVAYLANGSQCTATIIHRSGATGYALTAAHCIGANPGVLRQGDNSQNGQYDVQYTVVETALHPESTESQLYDFAMLRFSGATAATPIIAAMSAGEDNLHDGSQVELVGYGQTETGPTSLRHHLVRNITYQTAMRLVFDQSGTNGGLCSGDSGGPALADVGGSERVAGVSSYVSGSCSDQGTSVRVSSVYDTFIMPFINSTPYGEQTCSQCYDAAAMGGVCQPAVVDCFDDTECAAYLNCTSGCGTSNCQLQCALDHVDGLPAYDAIDTCVCDTGCSSECQDEAFCNPDEGCGFTSGSANCQTCLEENCCVEAAACAADYPICASCMSTIPHDSCPTAESSAFQSCLQDHCPISCNVGFGGSGGEGGAGVGGAGVGGAAMGGAATGGAGAPPPQSEPFTVDSGCGCATAGRRSRATASLWLLALCAARMMRRRRRQSFP